MGERDRTDSELQGKSSKTRAEKESGPWKSSPNVPWKARPAGFTEDTQATELREDLEVLS